MTILYEERLSDSPYVESITYGWTVGDGASIRPAETNWHMVFTRHNGNLYPIFVGPLTRAGVASWGGEAEILWIKFKLGAFMPHLSTRDFLDRETILPGAAGNSFWLKGSAWQFPDYENVDTFVDRLVRDEVLLFDPAVNAALQDQLHAQAMPSRTLRHRFLRATGLTQSRIRQVERAQRAAALLRRGTSILDTVHEIGYFDQPHLTRALRQWVGYTPAQIVRMSMVACHSVQDNDLDLVYDTNVLNIADDQYPTNREAHDELDA
jgi:AraC-like DNA-binding protein